MPDRFAREMFLILLNEFDITVNQRDNWYVKAAKKASSKKTPGSQVVEKHRPLMNKLTDARRQRLRHRAAELIYGSEAFASGR